MTTFQLVLAGVVATLAVARLTRLVTYDDYPPVKWLRDKWDAKTGESGWNEMLHCGYCFAPWIALPIVVIFVGLMFGWAVFASIIGIWWVFCSILAVGYSAAIIVGTNWG